MVYMKPKSYSYSTARDCLEEIVTVFKSEIYTLAFSIRIKYVPKEHRLDYKLKKCLTEKRFIAGCDRLSGKDHQRPANVSERAAWPAQLSEKQNQELGGEGTYFTLHQKAQNGREKIWQKWHLRLYLWYTKWIFLKPGKWRKTKHVVLHLENIIKNTTLFWFIIPQN